MRPLGRDIESKEFLRLDGEDTVCGTVELLLEPEPGDPDRRIASKDPTSMLLLLTFLFFGKNDSSDAGIRRTERTFPFAGALGAP